MNNKKLILFFICFHKMLMNLYFYLYIVKKRNNNILVEIDTSEINTSLGPGIFLKGINKLLPIHFEDCSFISSSFINFIFKPDYYYVPILNFQENYFQKLVYRKIMKFQICILLMPKIH